MLLQLRLASGEDDSPDPIRMWAPTLFFVTFSFLAVALFFRIYGMRGTEIWLSLDLGMAAGFFVGKGSLRREEREAKQFMPLDCAASLALLTPPALALAGYHFPWPGEKGWFIPFIFLYLLGMAWIVPPILRIAFRKSPSTLAFIIEMLILSGLFAFLGRSIIQMFDTSAGLFQALLIGIVSSLLLLLFARAKEPGTGVSFNAVLGVVVFVALLWTCFKAAEGLGIAIGAAGMIFPVGVFLAARHGSGDGDQIADIRPLLTALVTVVLWRVFLESTSLVNYSLDLSEANIFASLAAGLIYPFLFSGGLFSALIGGAAVIFCVGLFAMKAGLGAFILGVFLFYIIEALVLPYGKECRPGFSGLMAEGLLAFPLAAALAHPLVEYTYRLTRAQKTSAMVLILAVFAVYALIWMLAAAPKKRASSA
jgi:hypothetical protein